MTERAVYHSEDSRWYRHGEEPWRIRIVRAGEKLLPLFNVVAETYAEAFEKLYGHGMAIPVIIRAPHRAHWDNGQWT